MCTFCENGNSLSNLAGLSINAKTGSLSLDYDAYSTDSSFSEDISINFCPICGKDLSIVTREVQKKIKLEEKKQREEEKRRAEQQRIRETKRYFENVKSHNMIFKVNGYEVCSLSKKQVKKDFDSDVVVETYMFNGRKMEDIKAEQRRNELKAIAIKLEKAQLEQNFKNNSIDTYKENNSKSVGSICICPSCFTNFKKETYQQVFCKSKLGTICKDKFWNENKGKIKKYPKFI